MPMSMAGADEPAAGDAAGVLRAGFADLACFLGLVVLRALAVFLAMLLSCGVGRPGIVTATIRRCCSHLKWIVPARSIDDTYRQTPGRPRTADRGAGRSHCRVAA